MAQPTNFSEFNILKMINNFFPKRINSSIYIIIVFFVILYVYWYVFGVPCIYTFRGNILVINNNSFHYLMNVKAEFNGGKCLISSIPPENQRVILLYPDAKSGVSVTFADKLGKIHGDYLDVFLGPSQYNSTIVVNIDNNNQLRYKEYNYNLFPGM